MNPVQAITTQSKNSSFTEGGRSSARILQSLSRPRQIAKQAREGRTLVCEHWVGPWGGRDVAEIKDRGPSVLRSTAKDEPSPQHSDETCHSAFALHIHSTEVHRPCGSADPMNSLQRLTICCGHGGPRSDRDEHAEGRCQMAQTGEAMGPWLRGEDPLISRSTP